jgi:hypothetical protein
MGLLFVSLVIRTVLIVAITDAVIFRFLMKNKDRLNWLFVFEVIVVTIIPLVISIWFDIIYRGLV